MLQMIRIGNGFRDRLNCRGFVAVVAADAIASVNVVVFGAAGISAGVDVAVDVAGTSDHADVDDGGGGGVAASFASVGDAGVVDLALLLAIICIGTARDTIVERATVLYIQII